MSKERLEEIKEAIANELGLSEQHLDGTYLYYLTRTKSAFSVGTVTLDDFEEIDRDLLEDIFNAIKPFVIEQAERVQELEDIIYQDARQDVIEGLYEENKRYREALKYIADNKIEHGWHLKAVNCVVRARRALEESE